MALARLVFKNLQHKASSNVSPAQKQRWASQLLRGLSSAAEQKPDGSQESTVAVADGGQKSPKRRNRKDRLWRSNNREFGPDFSEFFPSGLGNALVQATENINRLMENLSPSRLLGRAKEHDDCYKLRYPMPGLGKEDVKITVANGVLNIRGEHKEEEEGGVDYGYYNTSVYLPEDAKVDEIKAEMKDGVLTIVIPKSERADKDAKEIEVQ